MIMPMIKNEFADNGYILEDEIVDIISIAQSIPGVMAISTSYLLGYKLKGIKGGFLSVIASILPCIIIIGIISKIYDLFIKNATIKYILDGLSGAVSAILFLTVINLLKGINKSEKRNIYFILIVVVLMVKIVLKLDLVYILMIFSGVGLLITRGDKDA